MTDPNGNVIIRVSPQVPRSQLRAAARIMEAGLRESVFGMRPIPPTLPPFKAFFWKLRNAAAFMKACTVDFGETAEGLRKLKECMEPVKAFCADELTKV